MNSKKRTLESRLNLFRFINLIFALILSLPNVIFEVWCGFQTNVSSVSTFLIIQWVSCVLAGFVQFYLGRKYYYGTYKEIFIWHSVGMNTFICLAASFAFFFSLVELIISQVHFNNGSGEVNTLMYFFGTGAFTVTSIMFGDTLSDWLEQKAIADIKDIAGARVTSANLWDQQTQSSKVVPLKQIVVGDICLVKKGDRIPTDGILISQNAIVDESIISGESLPVVKKLKQPLIGSSVNAGDFFLMEVTKVGHETVMAQIMDNVNKIRANKTRVQHISDIVAKWFSPIIIAIAILSFVISAFVIKHPIITNEHLKEHTYEWAIFNAISVIIISCPCALGIAVPLATIIGSGKAAKHGISFLNVNSFEKSNQVDIVAFDKTGTLTTGKLTVKTILGSLEYLSYIHKMESVSSHPLATAFMHYMEQQSQPLTKEINFSKISEIPGIGLQSCDENNIEYHLVSLNYAQENQFVFNDEITQWLEVNQKSLPCTYVVFAINKNVKNLLAFEDKIRDNASSIIKLLNKKGIDSCIISGDNIQTVKYVAEKLGIQKFYGNVNPNKKSEIIKEIQDTQHKRVAYVGDGINDLVALQQADLSISIGINAAAAHADINIINSDCLNIYYALTVGKETKKMIALNILWAFLYNIVAIPLAFVGIIPPYLSALFMGLSGSLICINSLIFKFHKTKDERKSHEQGNLSKR